MTKVYSIAKAHRDHTHIYTGTLQELIQCFSYTLECGNSWNPRICRQPKTIKSLLSNLEKSVIETQGSCYNQDCYWIPSQAEIETNPVTVFSE